MKNKLSLITSIFSFLAVCFLLFIFTFYVDGEMGIILIFFSLTAPVLSFLLALYSKDKVKVSISSDAYVKKLSEIEISLELSKSCRFPVSFVEIHTASNEIFNNNKAIFKTDVNFIKSLKIKHKITAFYAGCGKFEVESVYLCDFLGFFKIKCTNPLPDKIIIGSVPEIPEISASTQLFRVVSDLVVTSDEEEAETNLAFSANTAPGYEHREYVEGDSLRRVNWKASMKREKLLVRLDEAVSSVQPAIIFDLRRLANSDTILSIRKEEKTFCSAFGLLRLFINQGIACRFIYKNIEGVYREVLAENEDSVNSILFDVLTVSAMSGEFHFEEKSSSKACATITVTSCMDDSLISKLNSNQNPENSAVIVADINSAVSGCICKTWYLDDDNNFKLVDCL